MVGLGLLFPAPKIKGEIMSIHDLIRRAAAEANRNYYDPYSHYNKLHRERVNRPKNNLDMCLKDFFIYQDKLVEQLKIEANDERNIDLLSSKARFENDLNKLCL